MNETACGRFFGLGFADCFGCAIRAAFAAAELQERTAQPEDAARLLAPAGVHAMDSFIMRAFCFLACSINHLRAEP